MKLRAITNPVSLIGISCLFGFAWGIPGIGGAAASIAGLCLFIASFLFFVVVLPLATVLGILWLIGMVTWYYLKPVLAFVARR